MKVVIVEFEVIGKVKRGVYGGPQGVLIIAKSRVDGLEKRGQRRALRSDMYGRGRYSAAKPNPGGVTTCTDPQTSRKSQHSFIHSSARLTLIISKLSKWN